MLSPQALAKAERAADSIAEKMYRHLDMCLRPSKWAIDFSCKGLSLNPIHRDVESWTGSTASCCYKKFSVAGSRTACMDFARIQLLKMRSAVFGVSLFCICAAFAEDYKEAMAEKKEEATKKAYQEAAWKRSAIELHCA